jgi:hypothetical protein
MVAGMVSVIPELQFGVRARPGSSARHLPSPPSPFHVQWFARADAAQAQPYVGVTTDGQVIPGLFSLQQTGVSTRPIRAAAEAFISSLDADQQRTSSFGLHDVAWQRWNNTHPFVMRHGVLIESLTSTQRDLALGLVRATLSERGFETARNRDAPE